MEPRTGQNAVYGLPASNGALLALELAKSQGIEINILGPDDIGQGGDLSRQVYSRLKARGATALVGPGISNDMLVVGPLAQRDGIVSIGTTCENVKISELGDFVFRVYPSYRNIATSLADFAISNRNAKRIAIIAEKSDFGRDFSSIFSQRVKYLDAEVTKTVEHTPDEANFRAQIIEILATRPDAIMMSSQVAQMQSILRQTREAQFEGLILAPSSFYDKDSVKAVGSAAKGLIVGAYEFDIDQNKPAIVQFRDSYKRRFAAEATQWAAYGWDGALPIVEALRSGARTSTEIRDFMAGERSYQGLTGTFSFDANGDVDMPSHIYEVVGDLTFKRLQ
jgi:branched-chain amino acid transport system substrate-binding protein